MSTEEIDITPSTRLLEVLGDIPLQPWQCLAELIDNSLDELARESRRFESSPLRIEIDVEEVQRGQKELVIRDNGFGMDKDALTIAVKAGATSKGRYGTLGLFGMGFNIATARLGRSTTVITTRAGDSEKIKTVVNFAELQRMEVFRAPLDRITKPDVNEAGTEVRILLKPDQAEFFGSPANLNIVRSQLGNVYSYLLRETVPGISRTGLSAKVQASLYVAGERVKPKLPCVWSDQRSVQSYGQAVEAIQYVDVALTDATACLACGYWDRTNGPDECRECGSTRLELRARRVWGWLGVQRYIDSSHYGIDFLRFGRKILMQDKSLFRYTDPDTLQEDVEYPIEMPANQGRLIGEIHLDHVPVTYQKNDFDRQNRDWAKAIEILRGDGPMKPRGARNENTSYLARLFSAYRRNDPGLKYLTPGDGSRAIHAKAREWAGYFDKEVPRYIEDTEWYEAAFRHEHASNSVGSSGSGSGASAGSATNTGRPGSTDAVPTGGGNAPDRDSAFMTLVGGSGQRTSSTPPVQPTKRTREQELDDARATALERSDLSGTFVLGNRLGEWRLRVLETNRRLTTPDGLEVPAVIGNMSGSEIEVLVNREDSVFKDFGRDIRDVALIQAADAIEALTRTDTGIAVVYASLVKSIEDLKVTPVALQETAHRLLQSTSELMFQAAVDDPSRLWDQLHISDKQKVEIRAVSEYPNDTLPDLIEDGRFILLLDGRALATLIRFDPLLFFDNKVFRASLEHRPEAARQLLVNRVVRNVEGLGDFLDDQNARQADDLALAKVQIESLTRQLRSSDTL